MVHRWVLLQDRCGRFAGSICGGGHYVTLKAERLEGTQSAQRAKVIAIIEALKLAEGKEVTIYSDSAYAVGPVHV